MEKSNWRVWDRSTMASYGQVMFSRATGSSPEMECSKAVANQLKGIMSPGCNVLDVGCGAGHYLLSLSKKFEFAFNYTGVDATPLYIDLARKAFSDSALNKKVEFMTGDIYSLPFENKSFDVVICSNLLLHLPSISKPVEELWRCTSNFLLVRTLIGNTSFRIKQVREWESKPSDELFDRDGEPYNYHYFNIYSKKYISDLLSNLRVEHYEICEDRDYSPEALGKNQYPGSASVDVTECLSGEQVNGYIIEPWSFIRVQR